MMVVKKILTIMMKVDKMEKEFNLSEKIFRMDKDSNVAFVSDIKEFIKRLKEWFPDGAEMINTFQFLKFLKKQAGPKLITKS